MRRCCISNWFFMFKAFRACLCNSTLQADFHHRIPSTNLICCGSTVFHDQNESGDPKNYTFTKNFRSCQRSVKTRTRKCPLGAQSKERKLPCRLNASLLPVLTAVASSRGLMTLAECPIKLKFKVISIRFQACSEYSQHHCSFSEFFLETCAKSWHIFLNAGLSTARCLIAFATGFDSCRT